MAARILEDEQELSCVPQPCRYENLCSSNTQRIHNENWNWLTERKNNYPLWSRLKSTNCADQPRGVMFSKEKNFEIEIPNRLLSLFGKRDHQTICMNKMENNKNYQLLSNIFALCAALKYSFREWSEHLLDTITTNAVLQYPLLLDTFSIKDDELNISNLNLVYNFDDDEFKVLLQQVATGFVYIRFGVNEFNLARALTWFFNHYQFGLLHCLNRSLAFGYTLDTDYGFFMYDCQTRGSPLFEDGQANNYILRTHHLQILLYCLIVSLNVSTDMCKFFLYNVDIRILNASERRLLKKEKYVPTTKQSVQKFVEKKSDSGTKRKSTTNKSVTSTSDSSSTLVNTSSSRNRRPIKSTTSLASKGSKKLHKQAQNNAVSSKSETLKSQDSQNKIVLEPDKMYYIIAVPKQSNVNLSQAVSKQLVSDPVKSFEKLQSDTQDNSEKVKVNIHRVSSLKTQDEKNPIQKHFIQESVSETLHLKNNTSNSTLTPDNADPCETGDSTHSGLKVYLVDNRGIYDPSKPNSKSQVMIAHQLKDLLSK